MEDVAMEWVTTGHGIWSECFARWIMRKKKHRGPLYRIRGHWTWWLRRENSLVSFCLILQWKSGAIQKRAAYFGCIAALDDSCEALAPAEPPSSAWPASSAPPRWNRASSGGVAPRRSSAGSGQSDRQPAGHRNRLPSGFGDRHGRIHLDHLSKC